ncbi:hypothetical protein [Caulobacter sp. NIBR2454]|nr:hypothetical protein [Caulobacter sp. NIBR2454]
MSIVETAYLTMVLTAFCLFVAVVGGVAVFTAFDPATRRRPRHRSGR